MGSLEERVAFLEGRVDEQSQLLHGIRDSVTSLDQRLTAFEQRMDQRFEGVDRRLTAFEERIDRRFEGLDQRLTTFDERVDRRFEGFDQSFKWVIGLQVGTALAMTAALAAALLMR